MKEDIEPTFTRSLDPLTLTSAIFTSVLSWCVSPLVVFQDVDQWSFNVFYFHKATGQHALKFLVYDLLTRYDLINRFRVNTASLKLPQLT